MGLVSTGIIREIDDLGRICLPMRVMGECEYAQCQNMRIYLTDDNAIALEPVDEASVNTPTYSRKVDTLNRIVIPAEIRKRFNLKPSTKIEIFTDEELRAVVLKPFTQSCITCGQSDVELHTVKKGKMCDACIEFVKEM